MNAWYRATDKLDATSIDLQNATLRLDAVNIEVNWYNNELAKLRKRVRPLFNRAKSWRKAVTAFVPKTGRHPLDEPQSYHPVSLTFFF